MPLTTLLINGRTHKHRATLMVYFASIALPARIVRTLLSFATHVDSDAELQQKQQSATFQYNTVAVHFLLKTVVARLV